jgi:enolase-phosphatase E1
VALAAGNSPSNSGDKQVRALLLDVEGTTTPIDFVYKTLFPYASRKVESFLREHGGAGEIRSLLQDLQAQHQIDDRRSQHPPAWGEHRSEEHRLRSAVEYVQWLMAKDSKCTPLKALQGKIWQQGFDGGEIHGEVYDDVPRAFVRWRRQNRDICIYSSGSVLAQRLLFRTVASGDLTTHIAAFFDTQTGSKTSPESYRKIAASRDLQPPELLFISDAAKEIEAGQAGGMRAVLCDRTQPSAVMLGSAGAIHSFDEIFPG